MVKIKRALISVSDKTGIVDFAKELNNLGVEIISTGGTAKLLKENNITVIEISQYTGFPEMLDGRVKTLHPKIHGGLLALRDNPEHMQTIKEHSIGLIDMVVINLYPFEKTIKKANVKIEEVIENIDIGGPSMLRSAAKNHRSVAVICNPDNYNSIIKELKNNDCALPQELLSSLAVEVFRLTSNYDTVIYRYLSNYFIPLSGKKVFSDQLSLTFDKIQDLRYGENPHQKGAFYKESNAKRGLVNLKQLQGKELSFNNILDLNACWEIVKEFKRPVAVVIKHNNPCGVAEEETLDKAFVNAWKGDPLSAFGSIVGLNRELDLKTAKLIEKCGFVECIIAPCFSQEAISVFQKKKNLRLLELADLAPVEEFDFKRISAGLLLQDKDLDTLNLTNLKVVTKHKPTKKQLESLIFAWKVSKHVKSNAIVLAKDTRVVGVGAGQMSRVDAVIIAIRKSGKLSKGSCLASDAFFPKEDAIQKAASAGIKAIIQPGGSLADEDIIAACNKYKIAMVTTGIRHFRH
jgi:phosphoribosylaminoimidazolecarboxamide formyltransferase/IMP cyclohydrolase